MPDKRVILVTGGNTGLGFETVKALRRAPTPTEVVIGSRSLDKARAAAASLASDLDPAPAANSVSVVQVDVASDASIAACAAHIADTFGRLDVLINNAGAAFDGAIAAGTMGMREAWNASWDTNVAGTHLLTHALVPLLLRAPKPRIVFITSGLSSLQEHAAKGPNPYNPVPPAGWPKPAGMGTAAYRSSKTGMNMMAREWVRTLKNDGVAVCIVSPGLLATGLGGDPERLKKLGAIDPAIGAEVVRSTAEGERDHNVGLVIRRDATQPF